jgi:hypothetical protein
LWNVVPLLWLCEVAVYWRELEHAVIHVDLEHPKHAEWATCLSMQAMEGLGHFQLPGIVYRSLRHGAVHYHAETLIDSGVWEEPWASGSSYGISALKCNFVRSLCLPIP